MTGVRWTFGSLRGRLTWQGRQGGERGPCPLLLDLKCGQTRGGVQAVRHPDHKLQGDIMAIRVGVNGFGRVGRNFFRAVDAQHAAGTTDIEIVAVNDLTDNKTLAHLLKYDSVLGRLPHDVSVDGEDLVIGERRIKAWSIADGPAALPWGDLGVDVVIESTGRYTAAEQARGHLHGGAKKVVVSATSKGADLTVVMGVNHRDTTAHRPLSRTPRVRRTALRRWRR